MSYEVVKNPSEEEKQFEEEAQKKAQEIEEVLHKDGQWVLSPVLNISPNGIIPGISLEKKKESGIIKPEIPLIVPK